MIFPELLEHYGCTQERLRAVFECRSNALSADGEKILGRMIQDRIAGRNALLPAGEEPISELPPSEIAELRESLRSKLYKAQEDWKKKLQDRVNEAVTWTAHNYHFFAAADLAWDDWLAGDAIPMKLYAQGKIRLQDAFEVMRAKMGDEKTKQYFQFDEKDPNTIKSLNLSRLTEVSVSLARPLIQRRTAAQSVKYSQQRPFLKFNTRSRSMVAQLKADVLSERSEAWVDSYGMRHDFTQAIRWSLLYSFHAAFVSDPWHRETVTVPTFDPVTGERTFKTEVKREGPMFAYPHPSRVWYDMAHPLSSLNTDTGCRWVMYWDAQRLATIRDTAGIMNRDALPKGYGWGQMSGMRRSYLEFAYPELTKTIKVSTPLAPGEANQREVNADAASSESDLIWLTRYYEKVRPSEVGLGDYDGEVWLRLTVAGDDTVVDAEWLPSRPAAVICYNVNDRQILNLSMASDIMPYQDQVTNLMSQALALMKIQSMLVLAVDRDMLTEDAYGELKKQLKGGAWYNDPIVVAFSAIDKEVNQMNEIGKKRPIDLVTVADKIGPLVNDLLRNISAIISILERNQMMSPQEMGQFNQRETTASEVTAVAATTDALYAFISQGPDEYLAALKQIFYESLITRGSKEVRATTPERYPDQVIKAAGFKPDIPAHEGYPLIDREFQQVIGDVTNLMYAYSFDSREGSERVANSASAKALADFTRYLLESQAMEMFVKTYGVQQFTNLISEVLRLSGSPVILKPLPGTSDREMPGASDQDGVNQSVEEAIAMIAEQLSEVRKVVGLDQEPQPAPPQPA